MGWNVEYTDQFEEWWVDLSEAAQEDIDACVRLLEKLGPALGHPKSSDVKGSRHSHMRELRIQHKGKPYRVLYAYDPRRTAILLLGGDKTGDKRWYTTHVPIADKLYDEHLKELEQEENKNG